MNTTKITAKEVISIIEYDDEALHLVDLMEIFLNDCSAEELEQLIESITGSKLLPSSHINIKITSETVLFISTCTNTIMIPSKCESIDELNLIMTAALKGNSKKSFNVP